MPAAKPAALKLLEGRGNGKDSAGRKVKLPPKFRRMSPTPPDWMTPEARAEWERVVPELLRLELIKAEDRASLVAMCESWAQLVAATLIIQAEGLTIDAKQGTLPHPAVGIQRAAGREYRTWAGKFGLTPADETNLAIGDVEDGDDNPFD